MFGRQFSRVFSAPALRGHAKRIAVVSRYYGHASRPAGSGCSRRIAVVLSAASVAALSVAHAEKVSEEDEDDLADDIDELAKEQMRLPIIDIPLSDVESGPEEDAKWVAKEAECSFCRQFLNSPCKEEFKRWSKCVDLAKQRQGDYVGSCVAYTRALMGCTSENSEHFMHTGPAESDDVAQENDPVEGFTGPRA